MEFTEEEVKEKLVELGYKNVPRSKLLEFMEDLKELIKNEELASDESTLTADSSVTAEEYSPQYRQPLTQKNQRTNSAFSREKISDGSYSFLDKENYPSYLSSENSTSILSDSSSIDYNYQQPSNYPMAYDKNTHKQHSVRRKVARKQNGSTRIYDETVTDNESQCMDITDNEIRLRDVSFQDNSYASNSTHCSSEESMQLLRGPLRTLPAFIRSSNNHPHQRGFQKCDPVTRYHQFKAEWKHSKIPGETKRSALRWNIREQMLNCDTVYERPQHTYRKNDYVVPTDKKRQALRWQVRTALSKT